MRMIKWTLAAMLAVLVFSVMAASNASAFHPLFLTESKTTLIASGESGLAILRSLNLGIPGTIECQKGLVHRVDVLQVSPVLHHTLGLFHSTCKQTINGTTTNCTEPIQLKESRAELGLVLGNKTVGILLVPSSGTEFVKITCGSSTTTIEGALIGEIPEINKKAENQYNSLRSEIEVVFEAEGKSSENQNTASIELLGVTMTTGTTLKVSGFFGGAASEEATFVLKGDGKIEICTKAPQNCP